MKIFLITVLLLSLVSCSPSPEENSTPTSDSTNVRVTAEPAAAPSDSIREFLTQACVNDLYAQHKESQFEFRNSSIGYKTAENEQPFYVLCGEFRSKTADQWSEWIPFATIKTSGYEQWQGVQATGYCSDTALMRTMMDISPGIKAKMDSLQKRD